MGKSAEAKSEFEKSKSLNKTADDRLLKVMSQVPNQSTARPGRGCIAGSQVIAGPIDPCIGEMAA